MTAPWSASFSPILILAQLHLSQLYKVLVNGWVYSCLSLLTWNTHTFNTSLSVGRTREVHSHFHHANVSKTKTWRIISKWVSMYLHALGSTFVFFRKGGKDSRKTATGKMMTGNWKNMGWSWDKSGGGAQNFVRSRRIVDNRFWSTESGLLGASRFVQNSIFRV